MSKQELQKWENKLNLYLKLHPKIDPLDADLCEKCRRNNTTCTDDTIKLRLHKDKIYISDKWYRKHVGDCIEWIRYV
jgi:hypothetical protein